MSELSINRVSGDQFMVVQELLSRQDEVLEKLDALDVQVEAAIKQFVGKTEETEFDTSQNELAIVPHRSAQTADPSFIGPAKAA